MLLNDLPTNDFNTIFSAGFPEFAGKGKADNPLVFLSGVPGSFYGRLFPARSVHFVCSFSSLHWLSQVNYRIYPAIYCYIDLILMTYILCGWIN